MNPLLEEKKRQRFQMLNKMYELTNGQAERYFIDIRLMGKELGMDESTAFATFEYLEGERLAKTMALGGQGTITHEGVKEVEGAHEGKATNHFPSNIVNISNSTGVNVVAGDHNQVQQTSEFTKEEISEKLENALMSVSSPLDDDARKLVDLSKSESATPVELANAVDKVASKGPQWKDALKSFAVSVGSGLVVAAIKFALGSPA